MLLVRQHMNPLARSTCQSTLSMYPSGSNEPAPSSTTSPSSGRTAATIRGRLLPDTTTVFEMDVRASPGPCKSSVMTCVPTVRLPS